MKVKVSRTSGLTGSQRDYGLVTGSVWNYEDKPTSNNVGTTLSAVPRDEATIEAERGETVVGDLDNDGMVEHAKIGGKRHSHGGTPLNVPDGSFVFSDYRGLLIKNPDVLKNIFGMNSGKAVTPAKVARRYEINKFKDMLNDPFVDPIDRKTAQLMIDNNMRKLGQLALIQEGMKGFPDGIPAIAQPLMGSDFAQQDGQQKMRRGGIVSYKRGGPAKYQGKDRSQVGFSSDLPDSGIVGYDQFDQPIYTDNQGTRVAYFDPQTGEPVYDAGMLPGTEVVYQRTPEDIERANARRNEVLANFHNYMNEYLEQMKQPTSGSGIAEWSGPAMVTTGAVGGILAQKYGAPALNAAGRFIKNIPGVKTAVNLAGEGLAGVRDFVYPSFAMNRDIAKMARLNPSTWELITGKPGLFPGAWRLAKDITKNLAGAGIGAGFGLGANMFYNYLKENEIPDDALDNKGAVSTQEIESDPGMINYTPPKRTAPVKSAGTTVEKIPGTQKVIVRKPAASATTAPATNRVVTPTGNAVRLNMDSVNQYQSGNNEVPEEELGGSLGMYQGQNRSQVFTQFTPESQILNTPDYTVIGPKTKIPYGFTVQHFDPKKGYYTITNPDTGETMPFDMDDFVNVRQGELLDEYTGGRNAWRENALSLDEKTRQAANDWFQGRYDEWRGENNLSPYFYGTPGKNPYGRDKKFGIYTYSAPGIKRKVKQPETEIKTDPQPEETKITPPNWEKTKTKYPGPRHADIIGEMAASNQRFQRYPSIYSPVTSVRGETIYEKANPQMLMGMYATGLQNAGTGPDGAKNIGNITGQVLEKIAQQQQQVQEQINNPRFLDRQARDEQANLQTSAANAAEKNRYFDDFRSTGQDFDANWNATQALNAKMKAQTADHQEKLALIKAMYSYANLNFDETPTANATLKSITDTPITGAGATGSDSFSATYENVVKGYIAQGLSKEKAVEQANAYMRNYIAMTKAGTAGAMTDPFGITGG